MACMDGFSSYKMVIVNIDVTARAESDGSIYDVFGEYKMRRHQTGLTELNALAEGVGPTGANANPRYMLFYRRDSRRA